MHHDEESLASTFDKSADNIVSALLGVPVAYAVTEIAKTNLTQCSPCPDTLFALMLMIALLLAYGLFSITLLHNIRQAPRYVGNQLWRKLLFGFFIVIATTALGGIIMLGVFSDIGSFFFKTSLVFTLTTMSGSLCPIAIFGCDRVTSSIFKFSIAIFVLVLFVMTIL